MLYILFTNQHERRGCRDGDIRSTLKHKVWVGKFSLAIEIGGGPRTCESLERGSGKLAHPKKICEGTDSILFLC